MAQDMNLLQLTVEQRAQAMAVFGECADLREFGCRMLEAVMNAVMDADAQDACGAARGERSEARENSRNGYRPRTLRTAAGDLELAIPKLRRGTYYPEGILGRYTRVEASVVALVREMYVAGVSTRKVERVAEGLGVSSLSSSEVSRLCSELDESAAAFRSRPIEGDSPYVWLDATYMKCQVDGSRACGSSSPTPTRASSPPCARSSAGAPGRGASRTCSATCRGACAPGPARRPAPSS